MCARWARTDYPICSITNHGACARRLHINQALLRSGCRTPTATMVILGMALSAGSALNAARDNAQRARCSALLL
jgi:hypothetical protein